MREQIEGYIKETSLLFLDNTRPTITQVTDTRQ